jgi:uncharacterized protein (DUF58 family)
VAASASHSGSVLEDAFLRRLERLSLLARRPASSGVGGEHRSRARAPSAEFVDYRGYVAGDDLRRIDWNAYQRLRTLQIKLTEAREHLAVQILLDCSASMDWGSPNKLTYARWLAAALGYLALGHNDLVSVICLGDPPRATTGLRGRRRAADLLRFLDGAEPAGRLDLPECLTRVVFRGRGEGLAILITDGLFLDGVLARSLDALRAAQLDVVLVHVLSPQEVDPEPGGDLDLVDAETGERLEVGLSQDALADYHRRLTAWQADVESACWQRGLRYLRVRTDDAVESVVLRHLREAQVLA